MYNSGLHQNENEIDIRIKPRTGGDIPQPNLNYDATYWCSEKMMDTEPYNDACPDMEYEISSCGQCSFCEKQSYSIVIQREDQKGFISPKEDYGNRSKTQNKP